MKILLPKTITAAMIAAGTTIPEPDSERGEAAWEAGGTYALGVFRVSTSAHRIFECVQGHSGRSALPELDNAYWYDRGPSNRAAPFDNYVSTPAKATGSLTYVLRPGFINSLGLYGMSGTQLSVLLKDEPGGTTIFSQDETLSEPPVGWYDYLFAPRKPITKKIFAGLPIRPNAELTITISAAEGVEVGIGLITVGDYRSLFGEQRGYGTEFGASAEPVTYSYINFEADGTVKIVRRGAATGMQATVTLPKSEADTALALTQSVLDVPVAYVGSEEPGYAGLNCFGLGSGKLTYLNATEARLDVTVKGMI